MKCESVATQEETIQKNEVKIAEKIVETEKLTESEKVVEAEKIIEEEKIVEDSKPCLKCLEYCKECVAKDKKVG
ncbi:hypothetical protein Hanom_Chr00s008998g01742191 [Helianthus anomalus]